MQVRFAYFDGLLRGSIFYLFLNSCSFLFQSLFKLNLELNRMSDKIKDCLCKSDLAKLKDQQKVFLGQTLQQILNESDHKIQNSLSELKEEVKRKVSSFSCNIELLMKLAV